MRGGKGSEHIDQRDVDCAQIGYGASSAPAQSSEHLVTYGNIKKPMALSRLGTVLGQQGYRSVTRGSKQSRIRGWIVYQRDTQEITANKKLLAKEGVTV